MYKGNYLCPYPWDLRRTDHLTPGLAVERASDWARRRRVPQTRPGGRESLGESLRLGPAVERESLRPSPAAERVSDRARRRREPQTGPGSRQRGSSWSCPGIGTKSSCVSRSNGVCHYLCLGFLDWWFTFTVPFWRGRNGGGC